MTCNHKITKDHMVILTVDGNPVWRCSVCDAQFTWRRGASWLGSYECHKCGHPIINAFVCSPECREKWEES